MWQTVNQHSLQFIKGVLEQAPQHFSNALPSAQSCFLQAEIKAKDVVNAGAFTQLL
jgi:hypothetical protein